MFFDLPLDQLRTYSPDRDEPEDFDLFWTETLKIAATFPLSPIFSKVEMGLKTVEVFDVTFNGYAGQPIKGWLILPVSGSGKIPCIVEYLGYGGGRGMPYDWLFWASAGYAHFVMDTRGQGSVWLNGDTPDLDLEGSTPQSPGFMTRGIYNKESYYYRRLFTDAVRAVDAARSHPVVDSDRIAVTGGSQGGGISIAVSGLVPDLYAVMPDVPFLCNYRRAIELVDTDPYFEITRFLQCHRDMEKTVFSVLPYFDGMNFAVRAKAPALFSVALMDNICPPSTVYSAYNHYHAEKDIRIWKFNRHEGGGNFQNAEKLTFIRNR